MSRLKHQINVDCRPEPLNPMPIVDAVFNEIARLRHHDNKPVFVFAGEGHFNIMQTLMPYAAAQRAGLLGKAAPSALLTGLQFALELPHDMVAKQLSLFTEQCPELAAAMPKGADPLPYMLAAKQWPRSVAIGMRATCKAFARHSTPTFVVDASLRFSNVFPFLDESDALTRSHIPPTAQPDEHGYFAAGTTGMTTRNLVMQHLLEAQGLRDSAITWLNCGFDHPFGNSKNGFGWQHSLTGLFNPLIRRNDAHIIAVLERCHLENLPREAAGFNGATIVFHSDPPDHSYDSTSASNRALKLIHNTPVYRS